MSKTRTNRRSAKPTKPSVIGRQLRVSSLSMRASKGWLTIGGLRLPCALGRSGRTARKREGDWSTPIGKLVVVKGYYRSDRLRRPLTGVPLKPIRRNDGWCDAVGDRNYNRHVTHPYPASAEHMWRDDHLYDLVIVFDHNAQPRVQGGGSAIFMHMARPGYAPTAGCIALQRRHLVRLVGSLKPGTELFVEPFPRRRKDA